MNPLKMQEMLEQARHMQDQMQEKLSQTGVEASSGGGAVTVVDGWRPGRPLEHATDPDLVALGEELRGRLAEAEVAVPVFVPGGNDATRGAN